MLLRMSALLLALLVNQARAAGECESLDFSRRPNQALAGHVFKKLPFDMQRCMNKCAQTVGCFSINTYQDGSGVPQCELLGSTAKASPEDFVVKAGNEYRELTGCDLTDCLADKEARTDGSYRLGSSVYKLHPTRKTWAAAKDHCVSLGGNLASVNSETENKFLQETMASRMNVDPLIAFPWSSALAYWKFDGNDPMGIGLHGSGTSYKPMSGTTALYFDGSGSAEIPAVNIRTIDFSMTAWVYYQYNGDYQIIVADHRGGSKSMYWEITPSEALQVHMFNPSGTSIVGGFTFGPLTRSEWNHVGITWNRDALELKVYVNGLLKGTAYGSSGLNSIDLRDTGSAVFDVGVKDVSTGHNRLVGGSYMRDLAVFRKTLTDKEMALSQASFDRTGGTWIGLNDVTSEGTFAWSDSSAVTHTEWTPGEPNNQLNTQDCVVMTADGKWEDNRCDKEMPFICENAA